MKSKFLLFPLAVLAVQVCMGQSNPSSTNSQNAAAIVNNSGEYMSKYYLHDVDVLVDGEFGLAIDDFNWADGAGGQDAYVWFGDDGSAGSWTTIWPASSWPQTVPAGTLTSIENSPGYSDTNVETNVTMFVENQHSHADFAAHYPPAAYHRDEDAKLTLATGGPPGSTAMNLWVVTASATAEKFVDGYFGDVDSSPAGAIPYTSIQAGVFGYLDSSGHAYKLLPDNTNVDVTPYVPGNDHYSFSDPPEKYPLAISANGIALSNDVVVAGANFCVGQDVSFALSGLPTDGSVIATNFQWTFGGTFYNAITSAVPGVEFPTCVLVPYVESDLLSNSVATNWWVSGGAGANTDPNMPKVYTASVSCTLLFTNGRRSEKLNASGLFNMFRPKAAVTTKTGVIGLDSNYYSITTNNTPSANVFALHYGIPSVGGIYSTNGLPGIEFTNSMTEPTNFDGSVEWVQVINTLSDQLQSTNGAWTITGLVTNAMLDNAYPYQTVGSPKAEDSPAQGAAPPSAYEGISASGSFSMWLLFKPMAGGHWVPLQKVNWSWIGVGNSSAGLTYADNTVNPTGVDTIIYPYWTDTVTNR